MAVQPAAMCNQGRFVAVIRTRWKGTDLRMGEEVLATTPSPCIGVCKIARETGLCHGCLRTIEEITAWRDADETMRRRILARVLERRRSVPQGRT